MTLGTYSSAGKIGEISPIFKKNVSKGDVVSYRPVTQLGIVSKAVDKFYGRLICQFFQRTYNRFKVGFCESRSVILQMITYLDKHYKLSSQKNRENNSILFGFSKAFDQNDHGLL